MPTAESGLGGLTQLRRDPGIDLLLLDFNMPDRSGTDTARKARTIRADLRIAIVSGFITDALHAEADELCVVTVIFKPDTVAKSCEIIDRLTTGVPPPAGLD